MDRVKTQPTEVAELVVVGVASRYCGEEGGAAASPSSEVGGAPEEQEVGGVAADWPVEVGEAAADWGVEVGGAGAVVGGSGGWRVEAGMNRLNSSLGVLLLGIMCSLSFIVIRSVVVILL